ncbi:hypothetical protein LEP1GSC041_1661 [Leptospira noguchii str. 2006001870]|nr:hypothetical protein LEP1GSC041_1661 [Leptospira noguchii str. 2006001870]
MQLSVADRLSILPVIVINQDSNSPKVRIGLEKIYSKLVQINLGIDRVDFVTYLVFAFYKDTFRYEKIEFVKKTDSKFAFKIF